MLAEIRGRPFLAYLLDQLIAAGVRFVVLCTGHLGEQVQAAFGDSHGALRLVYSQEASPLGTAGSLRLALPLFESDSVLVMNGDSFCDVDLHRFWAWHCARDAEASIVLSEAMDTREYGRVQVDADDLVVSFDEKDDHNRPGWVNAGVYLVKHNLLPTIPVSGPVSLEREMFPAWIGRRFYGYRSGSSFVDIGTPLSYAMAEGLMAANMDRVMQHRSVTRDR